MSLPESSKEDPPDFSMKRKKEEKSDRASERGSASSPVSCPSVKSDSSREYPPEFSMKHEKQQKRASEAKKRKKSDSGSASSTLSFMSAKSDSSREYPPEFNIEPRTSEARATEAKKRKKSDSGSASSTISFMSAKSDRSRDYPPEFNTEPKTSGTSGQTASSFEQNPDPMESSKEDPPDFSMKPKKEEKSDRASERGSASSPVSCPSVKSDSSREYPPEFNTEPRTSGTSGQTASSFEQNPDPMEMFGSKVLAIVKTTLKAHKNVIPTKYCELLDKDEQEDDPLLDDETREAALKIVLYILRDMKKDEHAKTLERSHYGELRLYQRKQKSTIKRKNANLLGVINAQQWPVPFKKIYTNICVREGASGGVNNEHEVRQIEAAFNRRKSSEILITCEDIFKPLPKQDTPIRTVLTMGIAGIGKTVLTQKFMLDWSEEKANQVIQLLFLVPFRELNLFKNKKQSLMELLCNFSPDLKESGIKDLKKYKVLFILDGLDESRFPLDFKGNERCYDATQAASVDVLLTNLIAGNLLPEANLWITTRPAAASGIPPEYVDRVTEIRGFNNLQKEQYFHKKIKDEDLAKRVIANIRSARSLYIMCHVPVFCWISSIVLGNMCVKAGGGKMPKTLTQMYIHFLAHQTTRKCVKYGEEQELDSPGKNKVIMTLGKLAFQELEKGNLIFYEDDLRDCGIDVKEASLYSGLFTQVFMEESCMQQKVFCFVHLSVQEFLAALYVYVMYKTSNVNLMTGSEYMTQPKPVSELHKAAVDKALQSNNGHLDLFLRFLLGLSLKSSQDLLKDLKMQVETCDSQSHEETIKYIKERISQTHQPEKYINLFHCLNELNDHSLVEEIHRYMESDQESVMDECSAAQWAALVFVLLTSPEKPEEIQLKKHSRTKEGLLRLLPALKASKSAMLNDCNLTADCCTELSSTLSSNSNELNNLNLSDNNLQDSGIELLCTGLTSQRCRLKTLRLNRCSLTQRCCESLASVLSHPSSLLKELDLSDNDIEDSGVQLLCTGLGNVNCKLENLRLSFCNITEKGCGSLASAVKSNPSHLRELDLSYNHLGESGVKLISEALEEGRCEFTKLRVDHNAEHWFKPGLRKYSRELTVDTNTAHKLLVLSDDNRKVSQGQEEQWYPDHPDRFDYWTQVLFQQGLKGRCYWEVEWEGNWAGIGVTYKDIRRKGQDQDCLMGYNEISWGLHCSAYGYRAYHNCKSIVLHVPLAGFRRLAVYLDWVAGILSFYRMSTGGSLTHLHTFHTKFTKPLYPVFRTWAQGSSMRLLSETTQVKT